jgi:hypothetical protein
LLALLRPRGQDAFLEDPLLDADRLRPVGAQADHLAARGAVIGIGREAVPCALLMRRVVFDAVIEALFSFEVDGLQGRAEMSL